MRDTPSEGENKVTPDNQRAEDHPAVRNLLAFFEKDSYFSVFANELAERLPANAESTTAFRKLLEAYDCVLRSGRSEPDGVQYEQRSAREHVSAQNLLAFFQFEHLPEHLKQCSREFFELANELADMLTANAESITALRKVLEAKDCAVRSLLVPK
jgi:hypothetical protein